MIKQMIEPGRATPNGMPPGERQVHALRIMIDGLSGPEIAEFPEEHIPEMKSVSPPESKHALDLEGLRKHGITFWTAWDGPTLAGCGAIQKLDDHHAEVKSMRTSSLYRRQGVASVLLRHIISTAREQGYRRLSLETGSIPFFEAACNFYRKHGFEYCAPFAVYKQDPNSVHMTLKL